MCVRTYVCICMHTYLIRSPGRAQRGSRPSSSARAGTRGPSRDPAPSPTCSGSALNGPGPGPESQLSAAPNGLRRTRNGSERPRRAAVPRVSTEPARRSPAGPESDAPPLAVRRRSRAPCALPRCDPANACHRARRRRALRGRRWQARSRGPERCGPARLAAAQNSYNK